MSDKKTLSLEEILLKNIKKIYMEFMPIEDFCYRDRIIAINAMKEACQEILKLAAENVEIKEIFTEDYYSQTYTGNEHHAIHTDGDGEAFALTEYVINKQSIYDTINQIK